MTIGERIKNRREELGMTQDELARKCGYKSRSSINKIELSRDLPLKKISLMADALQTTPGNLMGWEDKKPESTNESLKGMVEFGKKFSDMFVDFSPEQINKALGIAALYEKSSPEVQAAIETLLKSVQQEP